MQGERVIMNEFLYLISLSTYQSIYLPTYLPSYLQHYVCTCIDTYFDLAVQAQLHI